METPSIRVLPCWGILKYNKFKFKFKFIVWRVGFCTVKVKVIALFNSYNKWQNDEGREREYHVSQFSLWWSLLHQDLGFHETTVAPTNAYKIVGDGTDGPIQGQLSDNGRSGSIFFDMHCICDVESFSVFRIDCQRLVPVLSLSTVVKNLSQSFRSCRNLKVRSGLRTHPASVHNRALHAFSPSFFFAWRVKISPMHGMDFFCSSAFTM